MSQSLPSRRPLPPRKQLLAEVAELADAHGSGPCTRKGVGVRVPSSAPKPPNSRQQSRHADFAVLVTTGTKKGVDGLGEASGVLVVSQHAVLCRADLLRKSLIEMLGIRCCTQSGAADLDRAGGGGSESQCRAIAGGMLIVDAAAVRMMNLLENRNSPVAMTVVEGSIDDTERVQIRSYINELQGLVSAFC